MIDLATYCPSMPVYEDGKRIGWFYSLHIRPDDDARIECQVCGLKFREHPDYAKESTMKRKSKKPTRKPRY